MELKGIEDIMKEEIKDELEWNTDRTGLEYRQNWIRIQTELEGNRCRIGGE